MSQDHICILRIIEYTGPRDKVEIQVAHSIHGEKRLPSGLTIRAATIGSYPEILENLHAVCVNCNHPVHEEYCTATTPSGVSCRCHNVWNRFPGQ